MPSFFEGLTLIAYVFKLLQLFWILSAVFSTVRVLFLIFDILYASQRRPQDAHIFVMLQKICPWISVSTNVISSFPLTVLLLHTHSTIHVHCISYISY